MVVIVSDNLDYSTCEVMDWLNSYGLTVLRINGDDKVTHVSMRPNGDMSFSFNNRTIYLRQVKSFWYRRGKITIGTEPLSLPDDFPFAVQIAQNCKSELTTLEETIVTRLQHGTKSLGDFTRVDINKLWVLEEARAVGLNVPPTIITTYRSDVVEFKKKHCRIITKAVHNLFHRVIKNINMVTYTSEIEDPSILSEEFFPSLFQQMIDKRYEVRIFFIETEFYPMVIFSQLDKQTSIDFRIYNKQKPNRAEPFNLPKEIIGKLNGLIKALKLNTGSIDMIVDQKFEFYFLEVNPIGQFGMVSYPCNYGLEKRIAEYLRNEHNE